MHMVVTRNWPKELLPIRCVLVRYWLQVVGGEVGDGVCKERQGDV